MLDLAQAESSQSGALDHVAKAVALLVQAGQRTTSPDDASFAETFVAKLSRVPERVARESIERARRAGVDPQVISKAESALEAGSTAFDEGRFLDAIAGYSSRSIPI